MCLCVCLCVHRGVDTHWPITSMSEHMSQWKQSLTMLTRLDVLSFCTMSIWMHVGIFVYLHQCLGVHADVSECVWVLLRRLRIKDHVGKRWEGAEARTGQEWKGKELAVRWWANCEPVPLGARSQELNCHFIKSRSGCTHFNWKKIQKTPKEMACHLVTFSHITTQIHTLESFFVHCTAWSEHMERGVRSCEGAGARRDTPESTQLSVSAVGDLVTMHLYVWVCLWMWYWWNRESQV